MGITAGRGIDGAGDADLRIEVDEPNDDLLLWLMVLGGFIGSPWAVGVLGSDGFGDSAPRYEDSLEIWERMPISEGAGEPLRPGRSIFAWLAILWGPCSRVKCPSFVRRLYICTDLSEDCVATYSFRGSHATPWT